MEKKKKRNEAMKMSMMVDEANSRWKQSDLINLLPNS